MLPLLLTLHLSVPQLQPPAMPRLQFASFRAPTVRELVHLQLPPPVVDKPDLYKGGMRLGEVGVGIAGALVTTAVTAGVGLIGGLSLGAAAGGGPLGLVGGLLVGELLFAVLELGLLPPLVALIESRFADAPLAGSLGRSVAYAYAGEGVAVVMAILGALLTNVDNGLGQAVALIGFWGMELIGVPMVASLGLHGGDNARGPGEPAPAVAPAMQSPPPQLTPPPSGASKLPPLPPTALNLSFRF